MKKKLFKRLLSFILAMIMLLGGLPLPGLKTAFVETAQAAGDVKVLGQDEKGNPISVEVGPKTYGSFQNVTHKVSLDEGYDKLCKRNITGEVTFDWPEPSTYVDVVFIQDFSGSFDGTIATVGKEINKMVNTLNFGTDIDGSPKDRAMIVTYQGVEGYADIDSKGNATYQSVTNGAYRIQNTGLATQASTITNWVTNNYTSYQTDGGTPTVDGMAEAQRRYKDATSNGAKYNSKSYTVTGGGQTQRRQRKTVYILITDGAANTAKWSNLPKESQDMLKIKTPNLITGTNYVRYDNNTYKYGYYYTRSWNSYYGRYDYYSHYGYYLPGGVVGNYQLGTAGPSYYGGQYISVGSGNYQYTDGTTYTDPDPNKAYVWSDAREYPDGIHYYNGKYHRTEAYKVMLDAEKRIAASMTSSGGVGGSGATFVSAFWEDRDTNNATAISGTTNGYGAEYDTYMKPKITAAMKEMAGNNPDLFVTSSNITDFTSKLNAAFKKAAASVLDNVTIASTRGVDIDAENYTLQRKDATATGGWVTVKPGAQTVTNPQKLYLDFEDMKPGSYKITYHMSESEYKGYTDTNKTFNPVNLTMTFEGKDVAIGSIEGGDLPYLSTNTKTDCEISLNKIITENKEDFDSGGTNYKVLKKRRDYFYFDTTYTFTDKLQEATDSLVIQDKIDPNLEILDVFLVAGNDEAKVDAISGATPNNTLIAKKDKFTIKDNLITYTLPEKPGTIGTQTFPYGGYVGKSYVLVVKVKIKKGVTDAQIEDMRKPIGGDQIDMVGIPNTSELLIDGKATMSNTVRAVPPVFQEPNIAKQIQKTNVVEHWSDYSALLDNAQEAYNYRIRLDMPFDTTTYETLVISDTLDETIGKTDGDNIKVYYVDPNTGDRKDLTLPAGSIDYNSASGNHTLSVTIKDPATFSTLSKKQLFVEFPVQVKDNADLSEKYDDISKTLQIHNISSYKINDKYVKESNKVTAIIPLPNVSLNKVEKISDTEKKPLSGAKFTLTDITGGEPGVEVSTTLSGDDGLVKFENLIPGRTYTIKETGAPSGYLPVNKTWTLTVDKQNKVTIKDNATGDATVTSPFDVENTKPETPQPEKFVKVSTAADDTYKKHEGTTADPALKLSELEEEVTYKVQVPIGSTEAFKELTFFDQMDTLLVPDPNSFKVYISDAPDKHVEGVGGILDGTISYSITQNLDQLANKTLVFEFKAKVGVELAEVFKKYSDGIIPNKADFAVNGTPKTSNEVTVTPPGDTPTPHKDVNGKESENLGSIDQSFTYNVWVDVPSNVTGYTKLNLTDDLEDVLDVVSTKVSVAGIEDTTLSGLVKVTTDGTNVVTLDIGDGFDKLAGKRINLAITAVIKDGADLSGYENNTIPNKATLTLNDDTNTTKETEEVPVTPPTETPKVVKDVNGKDNEILSSLDEEFTYNIKSTVPVGATRFTLSDDLEDVLEVISCEVKVNDVVDSSLTPDVDAATSKVVLDIKDGLDKLVGSEITLSINAKIKTGADLSGYIKQVVPNTATLSINDGPENNSNTVNVTPSVRNFEVQKIWTDIPEGTPNGTSPEQGKYVAEFTLYANGEVLETFTIIGNDTKVFTDLPVFDESGKKIEYTVEEKPVDGYISVSGQLPCGYVFTNIPEDKFGVVLQKIDGDSKQVLQGAVFELWGKLDESITSLPVRLELKDGLSLDSSISVTLMENGIEPAQVVTLNSTNLEGSFDIDPAEKKTYSIDVPEIPGCDIEVTADKATGFTISVSKAVAGENAPVAPITSPVPTVDNSLVASLTSNITNLIDSYRQSFVSAMDSLISFIKERVLGINTEVGLARQDLQAITEKLAPEDVATVQGEIDSINSRLDKIEGMLGEIDSSQSVYDEVMAEADGRLDAELDNTSIESEESVESMEEPVLEEVQTGVEEAQVLEIPQGSVANTAVLSFGEERSSFETNLLAVSDPIAKDGYVRIGTYTTDKNGLISVGDLPKGEYYFVEAQAPQGYIGSNEKIEFSVPDVKELSAPVVITVKNTKEFSEIEVVKTWVNTEEDEKQSVTIKLLANGIETDKTLVLSSDNGWTGKFENLPYKDNQEIIEYKVKEVEIDGFTTNIVETPTGYNIINTKDCPDCEVPENLDPKPENPTPGTPEYTNINGIKKWVGDTEATRPASIVVKLINETTGEVKELTVTKDNNWAYDFGKVMTKDADGKTYSYRVEEVVPPGYTATYSGYDIINTKVPEKPEDPIDPTPGKPEKPVDPTPPAKPIDPVETNPKTLVKGYGLHIGTMVLVAMGIVFADLKRRRKI